MNFVLLVWYIKKASQQKEDENGAVSNVLLGIFGANMAGYAFYYVSMKLYLSSSTPSCCVKILKRDKIEGKKSESISRTCRVYLVLALCFSITAIYFFESRERTSTVSPSRSRHMNSECTFLFFDKHDIWHFFSAFGILFTCMGLLTIEDNNTVTPWEQILVF